MITNSFRHIRGTLEHTALFTQTRQTCRFRAVVLEDSSLLGWASVPQPQQEGDVGTLILAHTCSRTDRFNISNGFNSHSPAMLAQSFRRFLGRRRQHLRGEEEGNWGYSLVINPSPRQADEIASADTTQTIYGRSRPADATRISEDTISPNTSKLIWTSTPSWVRPKYWERRFAVLDVSNRSYKMHDNLSLSS
jgi:hypothetical protein